MTLILVADETGRKHAVGIVNENVFYKNIKGEKHILQKKNGMPCRSFAFAVSSLDDAVEAGATLVCVTDMIEDKEYWRYISAIKKDGWKVPYGYEPQIALEVAKWMLERPKHSRP